MAISPVSNNFLRKRGGTPETAGVKASVAGPRALARLGAVLFVELIGILAEAFDHDLTTGLVFLTIARANTADIVSLRDQREGLSPPVERRPISARSLAAGLGLTYETARRYIRKLREAGYCFTDQTGATIPSEVYQQASIRRVVQRTGEAAVRFVAQAEQFGVMPPSPTPASSEPRSAKPAARKLHDVELHVMDFLSDGVSSANRRLGLDISDFIILRAIWITNFRALIADVELSQAYAELYQFPPDEIMKPASLYSVAKLLDAPYETVRRTAIMAVKRASLRMASDIRKAPPSRRATKPSFSRLIAVRRTVS